MNRQLFLASLVFAVASTSHTALAQQNNATELSVTGVAEALLEPTTAVLTIQAQGQGATAAEAFRAATSARQTLVNELAKKKFKSQLTARDKHAHGPNKGPITSGGVVYAQDIFAVTVSNLSTIEEVIDAALYSGCEVLNVELQVENLDAAKGELLLKATADAQNKIELLAKKLQVSSGKLLSAGVVEEPQGAFVAQPRQFGALQNEVRAKPLKYYVSLRYSIKQ